MSGNNCEIKNKCKSGENKGKAYLSGSECPPSPPGSPPLIFNDALCDCEELEMTGGTWIYQGTIRKGDGSFVPVESAPFEVTEGFSYGVVPGSAGGGYIGACCSGGPSVVEAQNTGATISRDSSPCTGGASGYFINVQGTEGESQVAYLGDSGISCSSPQGATSFIDGMFVQVGA